MVTEESVILRACLPFAESASQIQRLAGYAITSASHESVHQFTLFALDPKVAILTRKRRCPRELCQEETLKPSACALLVHACIFCTQNGLQTAGHLQFTEDRGDVIA
jgi:hypothetical protein